MGHDGQEWEVNYSVAWEQGGEEDMIMQMGWADIGWVGGRQRNSRRSFWPQSCCTTMVLGPARWRSIEHPKHRSHQSVGYHSIKHAKRSWPRQDQDRAKETNADVRNRREHDSLATALPTWGQIQWRRGRMILTRPRLEFRLIMHGKGWQLLHGGRRRRRANRGIVRAKRERS